MKRVGLVCVLLLACDDGGGGGHPGSSGVAGRLVISDLTASQRERVCRAQVEWSYAHVSLESVCTYEAVFESDDLNSCRAWAADCVAEEKRVFADEKREDLESCKQSELDCEYTVKEYEDCYKEEEEAWGELEREYTCVDAGDVDEADEEAEPELSERCQKVLDSCYSF